MQPSFFKSSHKKKHPHSHSTIPHSGNPRFLSVLTATAVVIILFLFYSRRTLVSNNPCSDDTPPLTAAQAIIAAEFDTLATPLVAILHYATAREVPQQSKGEIRLTFEVLQSLAPCNFLVFGIGHDSLMWDSFNPHGTTLFLEEDPKWTFSALKRFPILRAHTVLYPTRLSDANSLLSSYKKDCRDGILKGNRQCHLALSELPDEVYGRDWDVIMIDAPRGYFAAAPGRMAVIYSAAVMARGRKRSGVTHVFLHDVDREIERKYAKEFLCMKYRVGGIKRLWHFVIPPAVNVNDTTHGFC
ncbi:arabinogalactan O-methyltransferase 1-like [Gastrolobium bilobum]|uniref:arabinogalactan O-methyltransferase 1-like n=1 Tax=Gastrolobium bilobum TaxID=150636 RepID=UPI002AB12DA8|nr:arabinogalactan O-methyltransferase 1-like [Gastrolobium bilobum]